MNVAHRFIAVTFIYFSILFSVQRVIADASYELPTTEAQQVAALLKKGDLVASYCNICASPYFPIEIIRVTSIEIRSANSAHASSSLVAIGDRILTAKAKSMSITDGVENIILLETKCGQKELTEDEVYKMEMEGPGANKYLLTFNYNFVRTEKDRPWPALAVVDLNKYPESSHRFAYRVAKELRTSRIALSQTDLNKLDSCLKSFDTPKIKGK